MSNHGLHYNDRPESFNDLPRNKRNIILRWILENVRHRNTPLTEWTSYGLKHLMERDTGLYCSNGEFKGAMLQCRFRPTDPNATNWSFRVSKSSPAFEANDKPCM